MLKCDFHIHTSDDPLDMLDYDGFDLVERAAALGYHALAITQHDRVVCPLSLREYAQQRGILLIPGVEYRVEGKEVLLLGLEDEDLTGLKTFDDLMALKRRRGENILVIAPHPYYRLWKCTGNMVRKHAELFDAIEFCHYYTPWCDQNRPAFALARQLAKPMVACSDLHHLDLLGNHFCLVDAPSTPAGIFAAIRGGRVQNISRPLTSSRFIMIALWIIGIHDVRKFLRQLGWLTPAKRRPSPPAAG